MTGWNLKGGDVGSDNPGLDNLRAALSRSFKLTKLVRNLKATRDRRATSTVQWYAAAAAQPEAAAARLVCRFPGLRATGAAGGPSVRPVLRTATIQVIHWQAWPSGPAASLSPARVPQIAASSHWHRARAPTAGAGPGPGETRSLRASERNKGRAGNGLAVRGDGRPNGAAAALGPPPARET